MKSRYSSMRPYGARDWISAPLPMMCRSLPGACLNSATAAGISPLSSVDLGYGTGSVRVVEATYLGALLRASRNGLSWVFQ